MRMLAGQTVPSSHLEQQGETDPSEDCGMERRQIHGGQVAGSVSVYGAMNQS